MDIKGIAIGFLLKFVTADTVAKVIATCVAKLMEIARKKGGNAWDKSKKVAQNAEIWIHLFNEVYADDGLTEEEEEKIAQAIKDLTVTKKIADVLKDA